ncbi:Hsp70 protein-domain-containing protein [Amanita rubescens]|nr:Hsp70 protein-domain-containing protein [Amanita rubescens]
MRRVRKILRDGGNATLEKGTHAAFRPLTTSFNTQSALAAILAVDYGSEWIKASLVKPGTPFDVLLNKDSKRKIQASAFNLAARFPQDSFSYVKYLQGVTYDSEITRLALSPTSRKTVSFLPSSGEPFMAEDLIAMQLSYVKHLAESYADGEKVRDVIVTVPPFYTQFERDAMVDAIEIAGLKTLALINDGTAVAVNYAMTRTFAKPEVHVIYDAGASSIRAMVVQFSTGRERWSSGVEGPQVTVMGVGRMREILIESFNAKHGMDLRQDAKGMAKLWKEAGRVKVILSANSDAIAQVESIAWDLDLKTEVTREMFEKSCDDMKGRFANDAVASAGLTMNDVSSVILTGGASRTPMIQAAIRGAVGESKIAQNVNADEAAVLGAALRGASLSAQFRTKNMKVSDMATHDVQASYSAGSTTTSGKPRTITTLVFPAGSRVGTKKTMTFKRRDDFTISLDYKDVAPDFPQRILEAEIVGVAEAIANLTELGVVDPVVKTTVTLSESGFISVSDAIAYGEIKDDSLTGKPKGLFAASSSEDTTTESVANRPPRESDSDSDAASPSSSSSAEAEPSGSKEQTIPLTINTYSISIQPMSVEEKKESRNRLRALDAEEASKRRHSRNALKSQRKAISEKLDDSFTWLFEMGDLAETSQLLDKRVVLEAMERPIIHRYQEIEAFPQALNNSQMWNWSTRLFLQEARQNLTAEEEAGQPTKWTKDELEGLEKTLRKHEGWLNEWVEKQKKVKSYEDPMIEMTEMKARAKVLEQHLQRLVRRRVPKVKKTTTSGSAKAGEERNTKQEHDEL